MSRRMSPDGASIARRNPLLRAAVAAISIVVLLAPAALAATPGWLGESKLSNPATGDGWEPALAADPVLA